MTYLQKKKLAFMSIVNKVKGFVRTVMGLPPLTLPSCVNNDSLINYTISGNSVQKGTPTPASPKEIVSVGELVTDESDANYGKYKIPVRVSDGNGKTITTNIYLNEPLRKIGDYADYIDYERQKVVRRIYKEHLTTVSTASSMTGSYKIFLSDISNKALTSGISGSDMGLAISNKFENQGLTAYQHLTRYPNNIVSYLTTSGQPRVAYTLDLDTKTVAQAQELIGDGFDVYYVLAEPIEEDIDLPKLPTFKGTTVYSIETETQPSNMSATYYSTSKGD